MKNNILNIILIIVGIITTIIPFVYWITHPELTQMQIFLKFWWVYAISIGSILFTRYKFLK